MSGIIGPITAGRIAFALGTVGVGALIGGAVADHKDGDVAKGALIGGASALAGLALLFGGAYAWKQISAARTGAASGVAALGTTFRPGVTTPALPTLTNAASHTAPALTNVATHTTPVLTNAAANAATHSAPALPAASGWRAWVSNLFHEASTASTLRPLPAAVPTFARTPALPVATATSGSTFLNTMSRFLPV